MLYPFPDRIATGWWLLIIPLESDTLILVEPVSPLQTFTVKCFKHENHVIKLLRAVLIKLATLSFRSFGTLVACAISLDRDSSLARVLLFCVQNRI